MIDGNHRKNFFIISINILKKKKILLKKLRELMILILLNRLILFHFIIMICNCIIIPMDMGLMEETTEEMIYEEVDETI